jgi:hypothetical protein
MKTHLVCERDVGLFSLIQQVIAHLPWAARRGRTPIVLFEGRCAYWTPEGHRGRSSVWEYYFEPVDRDHPADSLAEETRRALAERFPDPREVGHALDTDTFASSHFGDHPALAGLTLSIPHGWRDPDGPVRRRAAQLIRAHLRPRDYLVDEVECFFRDALAGRKRVGVHMRGTDAVSSLEDRAHRKNSLLHERYRQEVARQLAIHPDAAVFVATDDQRSLDFMREAFGRRVVACDSHRHTDGALAARGPTGALMPAYVVASPGLAARNGEEAVIEWLLLSRCDVLIHNGSSLARTALLANPSLPHVNTHDKNRWIAHAQTFSLAKLRRNVRRRVRHARVLARGGSPDV